MPAKHKIRPAVLANPLMEEIRNCLVLIVEDDPMGRAVLKAIFKKQGFINVEEAENGRLGLEKIERLKPSLVVMDVMMPEMDGVECCKRVRAHADPVIANIPILVQTALDKPGDKARLFEAGATDYIAKPVDAQEIMARSVVHLEREIMLRRLREFSTRVSEELDTARTTQHVLMPTPETMKKTGNDYGVEMCGHYQPCSELGGDFWGMQSLSSDQLALYMVDFAGHGVGAALNVFRLHALMHSTMTAVPKPGPYLTQLNAIVAPLLPKGQFATMFYGVIDTKEHTLSYASAGAPPPIIFSQRKHHILDSSGVLLGIAKETTYETREHPFNAGDCLMLYSDALIETSDKQGQLWSTEKVAELFGAGLRTENSFNRIFENLLAHFHKECLAQMTDDLTLSCTLMDRVS